MASEMRLTIEVVDVVTEQNEDGKYSVVVLVSIGGMEAKRMTVYPNAEFPLGTHSPWEIQQVAKRLKEIYVKPTI